MRMHANLQCQNVSKSNILYMNVVEAEFDNAWELTVEQHSQGVVRRVRQPSRAQRYANDASGLH